MRSDRLNFWIFRRIFPVLVLSSLLLQILFWSFNKERSREDLRKAFAASCLLELSSPRHRDKDLQELALELDRKKRCRVCFVRHDASVAADSRLDRHQRPWLDAQTKAALGGEARFSDEHDVSGDNDICRVSLPFQFQGQALAAEFYQVIPSPLATLQGRAQRLLLLVVLAGLLALLLTRMVGQPLLRSLRRLGRDVDALCHPEPQQAQPQAIAELAQISRDLQDSDRALRHRHLDQRTELNQARSVISTVPRGLIAVDAEKSLLHANDLAFSIFGARPAALNCSLIAAIRDSELIRLVNLVLRQGKAAEKEFRILRHGDERQIHLVATPLELGEARPDGVLVIIEDVTALRRLEQMRKDFVANVSHELKTPLAVVRGYLETLRFCIEEKDLSRSRDFLAVMERQTARLNTIIDDLLTLSRLEQENDASLKVETQDLGSTMLLAAELLRDEAARKNVSICGDAELPELLFAANHNLVEQACRNLIENAIRYCPEGSRIHLALQTAEKEARIIVSDNGPGIAPEHQQRIFERFFRVDKSRDRQNGGSGLGLSIVKHIALLHRGSVEVDSALGHGARFTLRLPRQ
ncbi:MAG: Alkaline phosphatase synthesis sensor protein PhoR [Verrucomicrobiota bacterium]|jgi:two-component system phosphate regulon sensor histidine kinase PhoR